jgi:hypothetical protein
MKKQEYYPEWICDNCGRTHGIWYKGSAYVGPPSHYATYHVGECGVCNAKGVPVTEPRDYGGLSHKEMRKLYIRKIKETTCTKM